MNSRMDKYNNQSFESTVSRSSKNQNLYNEINNQTLTRIRNTNNYQVIDENPKEIDIEKIKKYINSVNEEPLERRRIIVNKTEEISSQLEEEPKIYDLNSIIEEARRKKETSYEEDKYKKLSNKEYEILNKLDEYNTKLNEAETQFNTEEQTLIDLINTVTMKPEDEGLLDDLISKNENTTFMKPIQENADKAIIKPIEESKDEKKDKLTNTLSSMDKSFYTNSMNFSKEDFEGLDELEKSVNKNNFLVKISIAILLILVIITIVIILNYVLKLGLF